MSNPVWFVTITAPIRADGSKSLLIDDFNSSNPFIAFAVLPFCNAVKMSVFSLMIEFLTNQLFRYDVKPAFSDSNSIFEIGKTLPLCVIWNFFCSNDGLVPSVIVSPSSKSAKPVGTPFSNTKLPVNDDVGTTVTKSFADIYVFLNSLIVVSTSSGIRKFSPSVPFVPVTNAFSASVNFFLSAIFAIAEKPFAVVLFFGSFGTLSLSISNNAFSFSYDVCKSLISSISCFASAVLPSF